MVKNKNLNNFRKTIAKNQKIKIFFRLGEEKKELHVRKSAMKQDVVKIAQSVWRESEEKGISEFQGKKRKESVQHLSQSGRKALTILRSKSGNQMAGSHT